ncbi:hypothetical protein ACU686_07430 [Yinghuangia aomiensis]
MQETAMTDAPTKPRGRLARRSPRRSGPCARALSLLAALVTVFATMIAGPLPAAHAMGNGGLVGRPVRPARHRPEQPPLLLHGRRGRRDAHRHRGRRELQRPPPSRSSCSARTRQHPARRRLLGAAVHRQDGGRRSLPQGRQRPGHT